MWQLTEILIGVISLSFCLQSVCTDSAYSKESWSCIPLLISLIHFFSLSYIIVCFEIFIINHISSFSWFLLAQAHITTTVPVRCIDSFMVSAECIWCRQATAERPRSSRLPSMTGQDREGTWRWSWQARNDICLCWLSKSGVKYLAVLQHCQICNTAKYFTPLLLNQHRQISLTFATNYYVTDLWHCCTYMHSKIFIMILNSCYPRQPRLGSLPLLVHLLGD